MAMAKSSKGMSSSNCFEAGPWQISVRKSHILRSHCERGRGESCQPGPDACSVCRFSQELSSLPSLPEMVFPDSCLLLEHESGCGLSFSALDALKRVDTTGDPLKVAAAQVWGKTREETFAKIREVVKPFDWTYTTDYNGTLISSTGDTIQVAETSEEIDYSRLKQQEKIHFYDDVILYEDELADNGTAVLSAKIRVMVSGFFVLLRFFLRVDGVIVRMNDTRIYHQAGTNHLLREYTSKQSRIQDLRASTSILTDPAKLSDILPITHKTTHKLTLPIV